MAETPARYGLEDLVKCLDRELRLRKRVYPGRVAHRRMTQANATREIAMMAQLLADHQAMLDTDQKKSDLFAGGG